MSRIAHALLILLYAALAGSTAQAFAWLLPELGRPFGLGAAALVFIAALLGHEMLTSRSDRLDLFEDLHDLRATHDRRSRLDDDRETALVAEMRLVRQMLARLDRRPRDTVKPTAAKPVRPRPAAPGRAGAP